MSVFDRRAAVRTSRDPCVVRGLPSAILGLAGAITTRLFRAGSILSRASAILRAAILSHLFRSGAILGLAPSILRLDAYSTLVVKIRVQDPRGAAIRRLRNLVRLRDGALEAELRAEKLQGFQRGRAARRQLSVDVRHLELEFLDGVRHKQRRRQLPAQPGAAQIELFDLMETGDEPVRDRSRQLGVAVQV